MGSCVSKKAARVGAVRKGKAAAPLPPPVKENSLSPVVEEVKEVVLSETPAPRLPRSLPPEPVKKRHQEQPEAEEEAGSGSETASVGSAAKEKAMEKAKDGGEQQEVVKRAVHAPEKVIRVRRTPPVEESKSKQQGGAGNGRARSPSPSSAHRRQMNGQQQQPAPPPTRPRREPAVVSGIGCRSGRFSPSAARRAAESAVRRTHSAREADMALTAKRSLNASINGGGGALSRRDPGERSGRRSGSPTPKRPSPGPSPVHRQASGTRRAAARDNVGGGTPERSRPRVRDAGIEAGDEQPALAGGGAGGGERKKLAEGEAGALGQNPSVAMECFIFL